MADPLRKPTGRGWRLAGAVAAVALAAMLGALTASPPPTESPPRRAATTGRAEFGPDVVVLKELVDKFDPVAFEHRKHARMAEMRDGCLTCHHRPPAPASRLGGDGRAAATEPETPPPLGVTQDGAAQTPACKSCHPAAAVDASIYMPTLKGAYHRQCLNCHRDWMGGNACGACHKPRDGAPPDAKGPTPDDIVGRMHPPIPEPEQWSYKARYTPADGVNVLFRHKEHTATYGIKCVTCHRKSNCTACHHEPGSEIQAPRPLQPATNWQATHDPCVTCHRQARCAHRHYPEGQTPPPLFDHAATGQALDKAHARLACQQCHPGLQMTAAPTCGDQSCHRPGQAAVFPTQRPGVWTPTTAPATTGPASSQPSAVIELPKTTFERIRR